MSEDLAAWLYRKEGQYLKVAENMRGDPETVYEDAAQFGRVADELTRLRTALEGAETEAALWKGRYEESVKISDDLRTIANISDRIELIDLLEAERERYQAEIERFRALLAKAKVALRPFGLILVPEAYLNTAIVEFCTAGDCRLAAEALKKLEEL
ncbi:MAG TPA: hypothetical protein VF447_17575 [Terriglobales bacterium]